MPWRMEGVRAAAELLPPALLCLEHKGYWAISIPCLHQQVGPAAHGCSCLPSDQGSQASQHRSAGGRASQWLRALAVASVLGLNLNAAEACICVSSMCPLVRWCGAACPAWSSGQHSADTATPLLTDPCSHACKMELGSLCGIHLGGNRYCPTSVEGAGGKCPAPCLGHLVQTMGRAPRDKPRPRAAPACQPLGPLAPNLWCSPKVICHKRATGSQEGWREGHPLHFPKPGSESCAWPPKPQFPHLYPLSLTLTPI